MVDMFSIDDHPIGESIEQMLDIALKLNKQHKSQRMCINKKETKQNESIG